MYDSGGYGPVIIITLWTETAIALVFVCMRLFTRIWINRVVGWDDFLIALSCIMLIPYATAVTLAVFKGLGRHQVDLTLDNFIYAVKDEVIGQTFGIIGIATSKASVAAFLLRLSIVTLHKVVLYFVLVIVSVGCFIVALFDFIRCDPIESIWNPFIPAKCWMSASQYTNLSIAVGAISSAADFILAILPWFIIWDLRMTRKEKNLIASSMSLGLFAGACGIVRTISAKRIASGRDYSYETVSLILWNSTELTVSILCATIPTLRPLYKELLSLFSRRRRSSQSHSHSQSQQSYKLNDTPSTKNEPFKPSSRGSEPGTYASKSSVSVGVQGDGGAFKESGGVTVGMRGENGIVCTDVVYVEFEERQEAPPGTACSRDWSRRGCQTWEVV